MMTANNMGGTDDLRMALLLLCLGAILTESTLKPHIRGETMGNATTPFHSHRRRCRPMAGYRVQAAVGTTLSFISARFGPPALPT